MGEQGDQREEKGVHKEQATPTTTRLLVINYYNCARQLFALLLPNAIHLLTGE